MATLPNEGCMNYIRLFEIISLIIVDAFLETMRTSFEILLRILKLFKTTKNSKTFLNELSIT